MIAPIVEKKGTESYIILALIAPIFDTAIFQNINPKAEGNIPINISTSAELKFKICA